ncbi:MAG TPA: hypothetical protein VH206_23540 [Xanthobacteraceae bacterium]|jgi:hypothetical protein|nr:hypothetical protein [Xanthobacteraceae bacterium]
MSQTIAAPLKMSARIGTSDLQMIAQVEKWMAAIRDMKREPQAGEAPFRVRLRPVAAVTE